MLRVAGAYIPPAEVSARARIMGEPLLDVLLDNVPGPKAAPDREGGIRADSIRGFVIATTVDGGLRIEVTYEAD